MMSLAMQPTITSASGLLAMLEEDQVDIKAYALKKLNSVVDDFWAEISECLPDIEALYEDDKFQARELAALVASKCYFQLAELDDALTFALGAGPLFDVSASNSEYVDTLLAKCIDEYCVQHVRVTEGKPPRELDAAAEASGAPHAPIDPRLVAIVERMFEACFAREQYKQALGIAIEARRLDVIYRALTREQLRVPNTADLAAVGAIASATTGSMPLAAHTTAILEMCLDASKSTVASRDFRAHLLRMLVVVFRRLPSPDYLGLVECLAQLNDAEAVAATLAKLRVGTEVEFMLACQVAFDLVENGTQRFVGKVAGLLLPPAPAAAAAAAPPSEQPAAGAEDAGGAAQAEQPTPMDTTGGGTVVDPSAGRNAKLASILDGTLPISLHLEFLCRNNHTDLAILQQMKAAVDPRNALCHSAIVLAHSLMSAGTTADVFLRENLEWLSRATSWAKFTATASLGVIHRGHLSQASQLLQPYLPTAGLSVSPFSEGGALYALGLIHANHGASVRDFLLESLRNAGTNEVVLHGACLALGLACMATQDETVYDELKAVLYNDAAVAGEAAALGMGLVMAGSGSPRAVEEMIAYAHDTQHEKIIRALALGIAIVQYGREEEADGTISQLLLAQDDILRYGGAYTLALAYAGSSSNAAVRRILELAVSDVSDNVRRAAVTALGFILCNDPSQCPRVVALLAESYNPHVRYGATMAVGVACAGTGLREAVDMLGKLTHDSVEYVRQGALIAQALVLMQTSPQGPDSRAGQLRKALEKVVSDKHEDIMTRFGGILASGLLEAGGRNVSVQLMSQRGNKKMPAIIGVAVFTNFWYWHPLVPFISLAFTPTALIGLNQDLAMPKWSFQSNAPPQAFAYPPPVKSDVKGRVDKVATAVLSTTAKAKKAEKEKAKDATADTKAAAKGAAAKDTKDVAMADKPSAEAEAAAAAAALKGGGASSSADVGAPKEGVASDKEKTQLLHNPARVLPQQEGLLSLLPNSRYSPVVQAAQPTKLNRLCGFVMLQDSRPHEPQQLLEPAQTGGSAIPADMEEPAAPAPFEFTP